MGIPFIDYLFSHKSLILFNFSNNKKTGTKDENRNRVDHRSSLRHHDARGVYRKWFSHLHRVEETRSQITNKLHVRQHGHRRFAGNVDCDALVDFHDIYRRIVDDPGSIWKSHVQRCCIHCLCFYNSIRPLPDIHGDRQVLCHRSPPPPPSLVSKA